MVKLNRIYTRTGDDGTTGLATGERVPKWTLRVSAYGTVDETNAALGVAALHCEAGHEFARAINRVQNDLFDLGADLATPEREGKALGFEALRVSDRQVARLEAEIDRMNADIPPLDSFVLPGGTALAAHLHVARTLSRRAEREIAELASREGEIVSGPALRYANRLSDWLFVLARAANGNGERDVKWVPGANR